MFTQLQTNRQRYRQTERQRVEQGDSETYKQINNNNGGVSVLLSAELRFSLWQCRRYNIYNRQQQQRQRWRWQVTPARYSYTHTDTHTLTVTDTLSSCIL